MRRKNKRFVTITAQNDINDLRGKWPASCVKWEHLQPGIVTMSLMYFGRTATFHTVSTYVPRLELEYLLSKLTDTKATNLIALYAKMKFGSQKSKALFQEKWNASDFRSGN